MLSWFRKQPPPQTGWSANAYLTDRRLVIHACSRTHNHRGWYNQPVFPLDPQSEPVIIGAHLRAALTASVWNSPTDDSTLSPHPVVVEAGYQTWQALEQHSRLVNVDTDKEAIRLTPTRAAQRSEGRGFVALADAVIEVPWDSPDSDVGSALLSAFAACRGR